MQQLYIRKIREGKVEALREWSKQLSTTRLDEARSSLAVENVSREFAYVAHINGEYFFIAYMESIGEIAPADMTMPVNQEHVKVLKECLEIPQKGELLYDIATQG